MRKQQMRCASKPLSLYGAGISVSRGGSLVAEDVTNSTACSENADWWCFLLYRAFDRGLRSLVLGSAW